MTDLTQFNKIFSHTTKNYLPKSRANPFVKWVGGKRALVPDIVPLLPENINSYYEPFVGGGALFFALESRLRNAYLSDINLDLIITYKAIAKQPKQLIRLLKEHESQHGKTHYKKIRDKHNLDDPVMVAARFIYLNKTCYNGLYRVNKQGKFNVPIGNYKNPNICDKENLFAVSEVLKKAGIEYHSFEFIEPQSGDFVYCDPPYDKTFTSYSGNGFNLDDQEKLRDKCVQWSNSGVNVMISNSDTDNIRSLYKNFNFNNVQAARNINCKGNGRGKVGELIITNY
ncbi:MAG: DNA adenine methylase [Rhodobacteraceae bacterium]|nr:DNA adenine methylase [Paracoccaceae bacterium]